MYLSVIIRYWMASVCVDVTCWGSSARPQARACGRGSPLFARCGRGWLARQVHSVQAQIESAGSSPLALWASASSEAWACPSPADGLGGHKALREHWVVGTPPLGPKGVNQRYLLTSLTLFDMHRICVLLFIVGSARKQYHLHVLPLFLELALQSQPLWSVSP